MFLFLLLLISKGYTITRAKLPRWTTMKLSLFVIAFFILQNFMISWQIMVKIY